VSSGIYKLIFSNGSFYIGRSVNIEGRYKDHCSVLQNNKAHNKKLKQTYALCGLPSLEIIETCTIEESKSREVYWISELNAMVDGLNISPGGDDILFGDKHPMAKYANSTVYNVVELLASSTPVYSHKDIENLTGVTQSTIKDIVCQRSHTWVKEQFPELYQKMLDTKVLRKGNSLANLNPQANKKTTEYPKIKSPNGEIFSIEHLTDFCNKHGLQSSNLSHVLSGRRKSHKGWTLSGEIS
jgi:group I intron endonuclease